MLALAKDTHLSGVSFDTRNDLASLDFALPFGPVSKSPFEALERTFLQLEDVMHWGTGTRIFAHNVQRLQKAERFRGAMNTHLQAHMASSAGMK
jgi:hypothetical protein